jgi:hypothetical protein
MNKPVTVAVVQSGLVPPEVLSEMSRWGLPVEMVEEKDVIKTHEGVVARIQEALDGEDLVQLRDTDLDMIRHYLTEQQVGKLHIGTDKFDVYFCRNRLGEYIIPWKSEGVHDLMLDPDTKLTYRDKDLKRRTAYFSDVRELFFGDNKAFMVCTAAEVK